MRLRCHSGATSSPPKGLPFQLFMATLPFRAVATIAIREAAHIRHIKLEQREPTLRGPNNKDGAIG